MRSATVFPGDRRHDLESVRGTAVENVSVRPSRDPRRPPPPPSQATSTRSPSALPRMSQRASREHPAWSARSRSDVSASNSAERPPRPAPRSQRPPARPIDRALGDPPRAPRQPLGAVLRGVGDGPAEAPRPAVAEIQMPLGAPVKWRARRPTTSFLTSVAVTPAPAAKPTRDAVQEAAPRSLRPTTRGR